MIKLFDVRYIGWVKSYPNGLQGANAWSNGGWTVLLTKQALYEHFGLSEKPVEAGTVTLYNTLGISSAASTDEVKSAYRRLAKQWHPDISKERDSRQQFEAIKLAHDVLGDAIKRAKYDAGLALQATLGHSQNKQPHYEDPTRIYRCPLRCGYVLAEGIQKEKFIVSKIHGWEDIKNNQGKTLVTSWAANAKMFEENWV